MAGVHVIPEESPFDIPDYVRAQMADAENSPLEPLHRAALWDGIPLRKAGKAPKGSFYGNNAESLDHVPRMARYLQVGPGVDLTPLAEMPLEYLSVWNPGDRYLPILRGLKSLRYLALGGASQAAVDAVASLTSVEAVVMTDARKVDSVRGVTGLPRLEWLALSDVRPLSRLDDLVEARHLRGLGLGGAMWTAMKVDTLAPLGALSELEVLKLVNVRVADGSLAPIAKLSALRELGIPNFFKLEEYARIAAALPNVNAHWLSGFFGGDSPEHPKGVACKKCKSPTVSTLGKPIKYLCPACDSDKVEKHRARWRALVEAARRG